MVDDKKRGRELAGTGSEGERERAEADVEKNRRILEDGRLLMWEPFNAAFNEKFNEVFGKETRNA